MHIHWSEDPDKGNAKLWWDGAVVLDKKVQTKGPQTVYFSQPGIHRDPHTIGGHHLFRRLHPGGHLGRGFAVYKRIAIGAMPA